MYLSEACSIAYLLLSRCLSLSFRGSHDLAATPLSPLFILSVGILPAYGRNDRPTAATAVVRERLSLYLSIGLSLAT